MSYKRFLHPGFWLIYKLDQDVIHLIVDFSQRQSQKSSKSLVSPSRQHPSPFTFTWPPLSNQLRLDHHIDITLAWTSFCVLQLLDWLTWVGDWEWAVSSNFGGAYQHYQIYSFFMFYISWVGVLSFFSVSFSGTARISFTRIVLSSFFSIFSFLSFSTSIPIFSWVCLTLIAVVRPSAFLKAEFSSCFDWERRSCHLRMCRIGVYLMVRNGESRVGLRMTWCCSRWSCVFLMPFFFSFFIFRTVDFFVIVETGGWDSGRNMRTI